MRDIALATCIVEILQKRLHNPRVAVRFTSRDELTNTKLLLIWDHESVRQRTDLSTTLKDILAAMVDCMARTTGMGQCFDLLR